MIINPTNAAGLYADKSGSSPSATGSAGNELKRQGDQQESGRTSDIGPAVITKLSAAALETTRPVPAANQSANTNRAPEPAAEQTRDIGRERRPEQAEYKRSGSVDVMA